MDTADPMPCGVNSPSGHAVNTVENAEASPLPSPLGDISHEASKTETEQAKQNSDGHADECPQRHTIKDKVVNDSKPDGATNDASSSGSYTYTDGESDDDSNSDDSDLEPYDARVLLNGFISHLCEYLLGKPREEWTDYLDCVLDPHENSVFSFRRFLEPHTLRLMQDLCNGVADIRRGGTGYFLPEFYRPPGPAPLHWYAVPNIMDRDDDKHERGPDPYDEGPDAHYEGHAPAGFTAIGRYHHNKQIWNCCDDLLNLTPDRWMDNLPGIVELIFDPRERTNGIRVEFQPETVALLQAMQDAFEGVPPSCIPGRMSPDRDYFEFLPSPSSLDIRHEIDWVPRMTRREMLASVPDRALHIRTYGRPKPDRRLEKKHRGRVVTSRGASDDTADYLIMTEPVKETYKAYFTPQQLEGFQNAFDRLMKARAEALRDHDVIDRARAQYRNTLASVNKPFIDYLSPITDWNNLPATEEVAKVAKETLAALDEATKEVAQSRMKIREVMGCKCGKPQSETRDEKRPFLWKGLCLGALLGLLTFVLIL